MKAYLLRKWPSYNTGTHNQSKRANLAQSIIEVETTSFEQGSTSKGCSSGHAVYYVNEVVTGQPRFIIDSGTTMTLVKDRYVLHDYREFASPYFVKAANGECIDVRGEGTLILEDANYKIQIHKVGYVPKIDA